MSGLQPGFLPAVRLLNYFCSDLFEVLEAGLYLAEQFFAGRVRCCLLLLIGRYALLQARNLSVEPAEKLSIERHGAFPRCVRPSWVAQA